MEYGIKKLLDAFLVSYTERDRSEDFSCWLAKRMGQECPNLSESEIIKLSQEIMDGVSQYDQTLAEVYEAVQSGQSKEEWLAENLIEVYSHLSPDQAGDKLQRIYGEMVSANADLMEECPEAVLEEPMGLECWNEFSVKEKALSIGRQVVVAGLATTADAIRLSQEGMADTGSRALGRTLQCEKNSAGEVKAVVAGVLKVAAEKRLTDAVSSNMPVGAICGLAGAAVEEAGAMYEIATNERTIAEALDAVGRASVAATSRWCADSLQWTVSKIPVVGPIVAVLANSLFDCMRAPQFAENVYPVVRNVAVSAWEDIKQTARNVTTTVTNTISWLLN